MKEIITNEERKAYEIGRNVIDDTINELLDSGDLSAGLITHLLVSAAMDLSYTACSDPNLIFNNVLRSMIDRIPEKIGESHEASVTHCPIQRIFI